MSRLGAGLHGNMRAELAPTRRRRGGQDSCLTLRKRRGRHEERNVEPG
jgi:hypothetical protein